MSIACRRGDLAIARVLIDGGADVNHAATGKATPLMLAARAGAADLVTLLVDSGAELDAGDRRGQTALMWAAAEGNLDVVKTLVDRGVDVSRRLESGFDALGFAARHGRTGVVRALVAAGAEVDAAMEPKRTGGRKPRKGMTPLMLAVESAHYETALTLVELGADPSGESSGFTALHALAWVRRPENGDGAEGDPAPRGSGGVDSLAFVRRMVDAGADVNRKLHRGKRGRGRFNTRGATPFLMAAQTVDLPLMKLLVDLGADPLEPNYDGCTPLMVAAGIGNHFVGEHPGTPAEVEAAVRYLVSLGADVNTVDEKGETAMHGAAYRCFPETVNLLVELGADPAAWNHENEYGWTPLEIAEGHRAGSFKPDPPTIAAVKAAMEM